MFSVKGRLPSKVIFHRWSSSSFESFSFLAFSPESDIAQLSLSLFVSPSWSTSMTSIIFVFESTNHFYDIVKEVDVKSVLKSSIFVVQKATAPKTGVAFCQGSIGAIRSSVATSYDVWRRRATSQQANWNGQADRRTDKPMCWEAAPPKISD